MFESLEKLGTTIADAFLLSFFWLLFSVPIFTIGASTTALFYCSTRYISGKGGYIYKDFWESFKREFKNSTLIWLVLAVITFVIYISHINSNLIESPELGAAIFVVQILISLELILTSLFVYPVQARFSMSIMQVAKNGIYLANRHILMSGVCLIMLLITVFLVYLFPLLILVAPGTYALCSSFLFMRIFRKYRPEIDEN